MTPGIWFAFVEFIQSLLPLLLLLLPASVVAMKVEISGSVDRFVTSGGLLLVSVKDFVCSVSVGRKRKTSSNFHPSM